MSVFKFDNKEKKFCKEFWIIVCIEIVIHGIYLVINTMSNYDEFTSIAAIETLAGRDWSSIVRLSDFHGYGFLLPLIPIFKIVDDGFILYKICMIWMLLLRIVIAELIFFIAYRLWKIKIHVAMWMSIICSFGTLAAEHQSPISVLTEVPLCLCCVLIILFVSLAEIKGKVIYLFVGALISAFAITIHARSLFIQFTFLILLITMFLLNFKDKKAKSILSLSASIIILFLFRAIIQKVNGEFCSYMYGDIFLSNSYDTVVTSRSSYLIYVLTHMEDLKIALNILFAQFGSYVYYSGGIIGIIIALHLIFGYRIVKNGINSIEEKLLLYSSVFGLTSWLAMNVAMAFTSVETVKQGNFAWYTYIRYTLPFVTIMVMTAIAIFNNYVIDLKRVIGVVSVIEIIVCKVFLTSVVEELDVSGYGMKNTMFNSFLYPKNDCTAKFYFGRFTIVIMLLLLLYYICAYVRPKYLWGVYLVFSLVIYGSVLNYHILRDQNNLSLTDATKGYIKDENEGNGVVYVSGSIKYLEWIQVALPGYKLEYVEDLGGKKEGKIDVFTDTIPEQLLYEYDKLDDNEWVVYIE